MKINPEFKKVALMAVKSAGKIVKENFEKKLTIRVKNEKGIEWVTKADVKAEETIRKVLKHKFPSHDIIGEEKGGKIGDNFTWVIDPIDGTSNYVLGLPLFSVALALLKKKKPILSIVFNPITNELYSAEKEEGAFLNQKRIRVNKVNNLSYSLLSFNKGKDMVGGLRALIKIAPRIRTFRCHGAAHLELCQIAVGKKEGFITVAPQYYDMGAGSFIVEEAGGKATDFQGKRYTPDSPNLIVTNAKIHNQLLKLLR